jgi:hypothetical protein
MVSREEFDRANGRGAERLQTGPKAVDARYDGRLGRVLVRLSSGLDIAFAPGDTQGLERAQPVDLDPIEISPSGLGLHFPRLDADLYLPALLEGLLGSERWMAARLGERGGRARSVEKATASRTNGKLGGRPRRKDAVPG